MDGAELDIDLSHEFVYNGYESLVVSASIMEAENGEGGSQYGTHDSAAGSRSCKGAYI